MKVTYFDIADFYKQLALLTQTGLPLPDTLRQLAPTLGKRALREIVERLREAASKGMTLSEAMKNEKDCFPAFFVRMIALGESKGGLSLVLAELARISKMQFMLSTMVKDIIFYPVLTVSFALFIFLVLCYFVLPGFSEIYRELLCGEPLPNITAFVLGVSAFVKTNIIPVVALYVAFLGFFTWLYFGSRGSQRFILFLTRQMPLSEVVFYNFAMSRLCAMWAVMMKRNVTVPEAFPAIADMMDVPELAADLRQSAEECAKGVNLTDSLKSRKNISSLLAMTVGNAPESKLPDELEQLAELFRERGLYGFRRTGMVWELITITSSVFIVGTIILMLFMPIMCRNF